jgi:hypothetical protein
MRPVESEKDHRAEFSRMGLVPLQKSTEEGCLPILSWEHTTRRYNLWKSGPLSWTSYPSELWKIKFPF